MSYPLSQSYSKQQTPYRVKGFRVEVTKVTGIWPRKVYVQWDLKKPSAPTGYTFTIHRSENQTGPWEEVATGLADLYFYVDDSFPAPADNTSPGLFSMKRTVYYRVSVDGPDGASEDVHLLEAGVDRRRKNIIRKLRRDAGVMLKKGNGTEFAVLKRRWHGEKCSCVSSTGQSVRSKCRECMGTGVKYGYWDPVYGFAQRTAAPVDNHTGTPGTTETHYLEVRMLDIPQVTPKDILVFLRDNKRFIVDRVITTEIHATTVHQELQVSEINRSAVEYNIPVDRWHNPGWF